MTPAGFDISLPTKVLFGPGRVAELPQHIPKDAHVLLVRGYSGTPSLPVAEMLAAFTVTEVACPGEPTAPELADLLQALRPEDIDIVVACGGGSVMDLGKALAALLRESAPVETYLSGTEPETYLTCITVPTTAGTGAEVTRNAVIGLPDTGSKQSLRGAAYTPAIALVDPDLLRGAPKSVLLGAGLDAVTQVTESYLSNRANAFTDTMSWPLIDRGLTALTALMAGDESVLPTLAWVATASGITLSHGGLGAAHGLAAVIGGRFEAPHGALCGRLLAPTLSVNASAPQASKTARARAEACIDLFKHHFPTNSDNALTGFTDWCSAQGLPRLANWGVSTADHPSLAVAAQHASSSLKNGVPLEVEQFSLILEAAQ